MCDLDHFKRVNDLYGHPAGDRVLAELAALMVGLIRTLDVAARYGGEEIAIIAPSTSASEARILAERLRFVVERARFAGGQPGEHVGMTISVGVAALGDGADSAESLIAAADQALYRAKALGRNRVEVAFAADG